ncbi:hypothetical protein J7I80_19495 [Bacillus sp. ISL-41]|uniref:hypothetical protein n=1 Tax=Bacillus sp. ISL-41 TaxID=2819127 RepID=UPI001BE7392E|nr:hypothetical protein [Bacillus sp. ISL-41]MBT2644402.1 hypothetical protein [Bacillus sp. ISL-41]
MEGEQIIPEEWIEASFTAYSEINDVDQFTGHGYLWWLDSENQPTSQWAVRSRGQFIVVDRENKISLALMNNTGTSPLGVFWYRNFNGGEEPHSEARKIYEIVKSSVLNQ